MKVVWSPTAKRRALEAVDFIARDRPAGAVNWMNGLIERIDLLGTFPERGKVVREWDDPNIREVFFEPYRVIYEVLEDRVEILTLSHERQDLSVQDPPV